MSHERNVMDDEFGRTWKKKVEAYFKVISQYEYTLED
jgi:hypothetical protein